MKENDRMNESFQYVSFPKLERVAKQESDTHIVHVACVKTCSCFLTHGLTKCSSAARSCQVILLMSVLQVCTRKCTVLTSNMFLFFESSAIRRYSMYRTLTFTYIWPQCMTHVNKYSSPMEHPGYGFDAKFQMPLKKEALTCSMIGRWTCVGVEFSLLILSVADSAPVELIGIVYPLFTSFYASLVVQDFFHQQHERALTKSFAIFLFPRVNSAT